MREYLENDTVENLSLRSALVINEMTVVRGAIALMRSQGLGCAIIVEPTTLKPVGVFTESSVIRSLMQGQECLDTHPVGDFADSRFLAVRRTDPILRVWDAVCQQGIRFVCVTDERGKIMGLTGQHGIAEYVADFIPQQLIVQRLGSKPWMSEREGA